MVDLVLQDLKDNKGIKRLLLDGYVHTPGHLLLLATACYP